MIHRHRRRSFHLDLAGWVGRVLGRWDAFIPPELAQSPELLRRSRLQIRFGWMGALFGLAYTCFYVLAEHWWGAGVILFCSAAFALLPAVLRQTRNLRQVGHLFALILFAGFSWLCALEGGLYGHAIAWLASIPLCVLLLLEMKDALFWAGLCFFSASVFGLLELSGIHVPHAYDKEWEAVISFAGYCGLICFMTLLGCIFERTRRGAFEQVERALGELSMANQRLVKLHQEKGEFLNIAAHDLKNPLCGINGYAELLGYYASPTPAQIAETSTVIQKQCARMLEIISNLLDVQRIEEGSLQMKIVSFPLELLLAKMTGSYQLRAEAKRMRLTFHEAAGRVVARGDEHAVEQILDNLISNAIKYAPPGTAVDCRCSAGPEGVVLTVTDQGPGLSVEDQALLFKKYSKLTPRPTGGESSNGLGLWIVHRMAESMNGRVECVSALGQGTTFKLLLPLGCETELLTQPAPPLSPLSRPQPVESAPELTDLPPWKATTGLGIG